MVAAERRAGKASACQKWSLGEWSLGDLVVAKIPGYPAWPAKISKPEDWGTKYYPKTRGKVFVVFFGDKTVGFCSPTKIQTFDLDLKNKLTAKCYGKTASDFTRAVEEICEEYDKLETEKQDVTPKIHKIKARTCIDSSNDSAKKMPFKVLKMHPPTHDLEEVLEVKINDRIQKHRETAVKKNDLNAEIHRQVDGQKKRVNMAAGESKEGEEDDGGDVQVQVGIVMSALDQCRQDSEEAQAEHNQRTAKRDNLQSELDRVHGELITKRARVDNLQTELDALIQELAAARAQGGGDGGDREVLLTAERDVAMAERDGLRAQLQRADADVARLRQERDAAKGILGSRELTWAFAEVSSARGDVARALREAQYYRSLYEGVVPAGQRASSFAEWSRLGVSGSTKLGLSVSMGRPPLPPSLGPSVGANSS